MAILSSLHLPEPTHPQTTEYIAKPEIHQNVANVKYHSSVPGSVAPHMEQLCCSLPYGGR